MTTTGEGHFIKPRDRARCNCSVNGCGAPGYWMSYSRFRGPDGDAIAFYPVCREHAPSAVFRIKLGKREILIASSTAGDARACAFRAWFGDGVFWDAEDGRGRVVQQRLVKRRGKERFVEEPLTPWGKLSVKEVRS